MKNSMINRVRSVALCAVVVGTLILSSACSKNDTVSENDIGNESVSEEVSVSDMSVDEKLSQMIIPAIRTWNENDVTDIEEVPELKEALKKHQFGGIILFGQNIRDTDQIVRLVSSLQSNNLENDNVSAHIPYLMPLDEEGGLVVRLVNGTRMTGNMAIGATGENAAENAGITGRIIGEELSALGFNIDFAPVVDVNNNASNPVIGVRSFSDDPEVVAELGTNYMDGLSDVNIAATCKHFPGHGDTDVDSHIGTPTVNKTYDELRETELVPFQAMIDNGTDMIMTAHITFPEIDDEVTFGDGTTKGYYPATMSKKIITDILRNDMGYDGVVVTDALEMDAIRNSGLVPGEIDSTEYRVNLAEKVINAGVDILLIPQDLNNEEAVEFYDDYISGLEAKVEDGSIPIERIDESVERILNFKEKYGIVESAFTDINVEDRIKDAEGIVGSGEHHKNEMDIACEAVTLLKNDGNTLPISGDEDVFVLGRVEEDRTLIESTVSSLIEEGALSKDSDVEYDYYIEPDPEGDKLHYTEEMSEKIKAADVVIGMTQTANAGALAEGEPLYQAIHNAIEDTHEGGGKFVLLSCRLPYDAARFNDADAILLDYLGVAMDMDPTAGGKDASVVGAFNANAVAAIETIFGKNDPSGKLPVNIPRVVVNDDGTIAYGDEILYERGFGLSMN